MRQGHLHHNTRAQQRRWWQYDLTHFSRLPSGDENEVPISVDLGLKDVERCKIRVIISMISMSDYIFIIIIMIEEDQGGLPNAPVVMEHDNNRA